MLRRLLLTSALVGFAMLAGGGSLIGAGPLIGAGTAWAHAGGLTSTTSEPVILGVEPPVPGLRLDVVEFGARLRLENRGTQLLLVEPPIGTALNALPVVQPGDVAFWSDPRIAWAAGQPRPAGDRLAWEIPLRVGETPVTVTGEQYWPPPPDAGAWWLLLAVAIAVPAGLSYASCRWSRRRGPVPGRGSDRRRGPDPRVARLEDGSGAELAATPVLARTVLAVSTLLVICAHLVHIYGSALVPAQGEVIWLFLGAAGFSIIAWPLGLAGVYYTLRRSPAGPLLCLVAGALIAVIISPADIFSFHDAVIPYAWGADLDRFLIALNVGGGLGVIAAATVLMRNTHTEPGPAPEPAP